MAYSDITFNDRNFIKRWLQFRRLVVAVNLPNRELSPEMILDFGAGNGELCKLIAWRFPSAKIICYEPTPFLLAEARENLKHLSQITFVDDLRMVLNESIDLIFCLEVLEHLPATELNAAIKSFHTLLKQTGVAVVGVPVEIGIPALYKGIFRMIRRFGAFDANFKSIALATICQPPKNRPISEISNGFRFHYEHMGFDHRKLDDLFREKFKILMKKTSPFAIFGHFLNPEINFILTKKF
jgi:SAM-dependent methyltransferase